MISLTLVVQKTEGVIELVDDLLNRTKEYLQPNPGEYWMAGPLSRD